MPVTKFFRGIGFRIAALTALLVLISMLVLGATAFSFISSTMQKRVRASISSEIESLVRQGRPPDTEALQREIMRRMRGSGPRQFFYSLTSPAGQQIAGDPWLKTAKPGWHRIEVKDGDDGGALSEDVIALGISLQDRAVFAVGRDAHWIAEVEDELLEILGWTLLAGVLLAGVTAAIVKTLIARRLHTLAVTATAIMNGNLSQRMAVTGAGDDFDRLSMTLNVMLDRLSDLMDNLQQVSNDIAHDLRTPLGRLRQKLEKAQTGASSPADFQATIEDALAEADGLLSTFTAVLRIAQIDAGVPRAGFESIVLSEIAKTVAEAYEPSVSEGGRHLKSRILPDLSVNGDRDLLTQLVANLIENAVAHTPAGTTIEVAVDSVGDDVVLSVADDGYGVPADEREKIFRRFYRAQRSRTTPGTGLGLNLVAAVAHLHGAKVAADDNAPGLRITVRFPEKQDS